MKNFNGFTMAETLTVLILIGVVIVISMPTIIHKHFESVRRIKVKKAMTIYDVAIHSMFNEHGFTTKSALLNWANSATATDCANTSPYFKKIDSINGCVFKTADNVWWNISKIDNPIIIFNPEWINCLNGKSQCEQDVLETLAKSESIDAFAMSFEVDDKTGIIHVNDKVFEDDLNNNDDNKTYMAKLFDFINDKKFSSDIIIPQPVPPELPPDVTLCDTQGQKCSANYKGLIADCTNGEATKVIYCENGSQKSYTTENPKIIENCNGDKIALIMKNGVVNEIQYLGEDFVSNINSNENKIIEVYQDKNITGENRGTRIVKYNYDGDTFRQAWWYKPENGGSFSWMAMQYEYNGTYYYVETNGGTNIALACSSDKPFYLISSQNYATNGTKNCSKPNTAISKLTDGNLKTAMESAYSAGYFTQPSQPNKFSHFSNDDLSIGNILKNYYQCLSQ